MEHTIVEAQSYDMWADLILLSPTFDNLIHAVILCFSFYNIVTRLNYKSMLYVLYNWGVNGLLNFRTKNLCSALGHTLWCYCHVWFIWQSASFQLSPIVPFCYWHLFNFQKVETAFELKTEYLLSSLECIRAFEPLCWKKFVSFCCCCWIYEFCWHLLLAAPFKTQSSIIVFFPLFN